MANPNAEVIRRAGGPTHVAKRFGIGVRRVRKWTEPDRGVPRAYRRGVAALIRERGNEVPEGFETERDVMPVSADDAGAGAQQFA